MLRNFSEQLFYRTLLGDCFNACKIKDAAYFNDFQGAKEAIDRRATFRNSKSSTLGIF